MDCPERVETVSAGAVFRIPFSGRKAGNSAVRTALNNPQSGHLYTYMEGNAGIEGFLYHKYSGK
jgi:hypothetical protein